MQKRGLKAGISAVLLGSLSTFAYAKLPPIRISALSDPFLMTPKNTPGLISYKIFNSSNKIYHLSLQELAGITQDTNVKNSCDQGLISLEPGHSCVLSLQVRAQELSGNKLAPLLCDYDQEQLTMGQCFEPAFEEKISIKELEDNQASFSMKVKLPKKVNSEGLSDGYKRCFASFAGCNITLFVGSSAGGQLVLTNTSGQVLRNLHAYDLPTGVSSTASSNCAVLPNGQKCILNFSPGSIHNLGKTVSVKGDNTPISTITMQVLQIGDLYLGNQLYELPFTSVNSSPLYYTALPYDLPLVVGTNLGTACTTGTIVPPINSLMQLYNASNYPRSGGPINGFKCDDTGFYWSSSSFSPSTHETILFADGYEITRSDNSSAYIRCVNGYSL